MSNASLLLHVLEEEQKLHGPSFRADWICGILTVEPPAKIPKYLGISQNSVWKVL